MNRQPWKLKTKNVQRQRKLLFFALKEVISNNAESYPCNRKARLIILLPLEGLANIRTQIKCEKV